MQEEPPDGAKWSFWRDDLPALVRIVVGGLLTALLTWGFYRLWPWD